MTPGYDVAVVGGGTAGAIVAARLSEDPARRVALLEAGPVPLDRAGFPPDLLDSGSLAGARPGRPESWTHRTRLTGDRDYTAVSGRILGGSSTINGGYFIRPRRADLEEWGRLGGPYWDPERALAGLVELEHDLDLGASGGHGDRGPIPVQRTARDTAAALRFAEACAELGHPEEPDKNAGDPGGPDGFGPVPCNASDGIRWNTGLAVLLPALPRPNLAVLGHARVRRLVLSRGRVTGVEYEAGGRSRRLVADRVVLCAGPYATPRLLLHSGIGPADELRRVGVPVVADSPRLGRTFSDHPQLVVAGGPAASASPGPAGGGRGADWLAGVLHTGGLEVLATSRPLAALLGDRTQGGPPTLLAQVVTPRRQGRMRLVSADPDVPLAVDHGYLEDAAERAELRELARLCLALLGTRSWGGVVGLDGTDASDDAALDRWIAGRLETAAHLCGSVPFGGEDAPLDGSGAVRGIEGVRVADVSMLPAAPRRGPAAAAALIGWLAGGQG